MKAALLAGVRNYQDDVNNPQLGFKEPGDMSTRSIKT